MSEELPPIPRRRFYLVLDWGADDRASLAHALRHIAFEIESERSSGRVTSGAPSDGGNYTLTEDPEMTHEKYIAAIDGWLAQERKTGGAT